MTRRRLGIASLLALASIALAPVRAGAVATPPQGTQSDAAYARSYAANHVTNVDATTQRTSCYTPEVPFFTNLGPAESFSGMSPCNGASSTGEDLGPYATQAGSSAGSPASTPMLVKNHSESDIRVDPTNSNHLIGSSKWFVSSEGYNHVLGFYESFDGGATWPVQGHVPGYEGWTDNTDPVGAFDPYGNYYELLLPYSFSYDSTGHKLFQKSKLPNLSLPAEAVTIAVHPHGATTAGNWITTYNGRPDYVGGSGFDAQGREPDKQWITIDTNPGSPHYGRIYAMFVLFSFDGLMSKPYVSYADARPDGTHTQWSAPQVLPTGSGSASDTYMLPHVAADGTVWTTVTNFPSRQQRSTYSINVIWSTDGGANWAGPLPTPAQAVALAPFSPGYVNTTFRSGITNSFAVGPGKTSKNAYPLYVTWEDDAGGIANNYASWSADGGGTWSSPILVNDNASSVDEFQPQVEAGPSGTVAVTFYDRRLACPAAGTNEARAAGLARDTVNGNYSGSLPPYGASNYCVNTSVQLYDAALNPIGNNVRLSAHTWDPELNSAHWSCACSMGGFIGDYFGIQVTATKVYVTSVSTFNDGTNPEFRQQQIVAMLAL